MNNNNNVFWKASKDSDVLIHGSYEDFDVYVQQLIKVQKKIAQGLKYVYQTDDGGDTYTTVRATLPPKESTQTYVKPPVKEDTEKTEQLSFEFKEEEKVKSPKKKVSKSKRRTKSKKKPFESIASEE